MSPTLQFLPDLLEVTEEAAILPRPLFLHLLTARQRAIRRVKGTEMAAATTTEELTSAGTTNSRPLATMEGDWAGTEEGERVLGCGAPGEKKVISFYGVLIAAKCRNYKIN